MAGCHWQITFRTTIAPDGRTERCVSVVGERVGAVGDAFDTARLRMWAGREVGQDSYSVRGVFTNPATMPSGYVRRIRDTGETAPSRVDWQRTDRVFYTLYTYRETVTNVVTPDRFDSACERAIDVGIDLACHVSQECLGDTYDVSRLTAHLRRRVRPGLKSVAWALYATAGREVDLDSADADRFTRYYEQRIGIGPGSLSLFEDCSETEARRILTQFVADRVRLKGAKDRPLDEQRRHRLVETLGSKAMQKAVEASAERYLERRVGGEAAQHALFGRLWVSLFGAYGRLLGPGFRFRASLQMPGQVIRTNGRLLGPSEVVWRFTGDDAYPFGYAMRAVSVIFHEEAQQAVSGQAFLASPRQLFEFESVLPPGASEGSAIETALRACVKAGSLAPLGRLIEEEGAQSETGKRAAAVRRFITGGKKQE